MVVIMRIADLVLRTEAGESTGELSSVAFVLIEGALHRVGVAGCELVVGRGRPVAALLKGGHA